MKRPSSETHVARILLQATFHTTEPLDSEKVRSLLASFGFDLSREIEMHNSLSVQTLVTAVQRWTKIIGE